MPVRLWLTIALLGSAAIVARAADSPLHERIDRRVAERSAGFAPAGRTDDAAFARRLYLDFAGRIPTVEELEAFLADSTPEKRERLLDRLLESEEFVRAQAEWLNALLLERRGDDPQWSAFLRGAVRRNLPWDEFVRGMLQAGPTSEEYQGAGYFLSKRLVKEGAMAAVDTPGLTRDVGRLFAGVDLQCAQCHDDLYVDDYKQQDFQGLHIVFDNLQLRTDLPYPAVAEKLLTEPVEFVSVFKQVPRTTGPRAPGGEEITIPTFPPGEEYLIKPDRKTREVGRPKFSPLENLAADLAAAENKLFAANIANRLWFRLMGRGLVEPLDQFHAGNPPSDPELLNLLAEDLAARRFDLRYFLRELALTETYQRASTLDAEELPPPETFTVALERRLSAEQLFWSVLTATGEGERLRQSQGEAEQQDSSPAPLTELENVVQRTPALQELRALFLKHYANPPREPEVAFTPSVQGALFIMHDRELLSLLERRPGNLVDRSLEAAGDEAVAALLFRSILGRDPTEDDAADVRAALAVAPEQREAAIRNLAWALLASTEFCLNH